MQCTCYMGQIQCTANFEESGNLINMQCNNLDRCKNMTRGSNIAQCKKFYRGESSLSADFSTHFNVRGLPNSLKYNFRCGHW